MNIILIGGCGYIGSKLHAHLVRAKHTVHVIDSEYRGNPAGISHLRGDYRDFIRFDADDAVIWLAGHSSVQRCLDQPWKAFDNNLSGLVRLARCLEGQPLIYASSASVYAIKDGRATNMYDYTKAAADEALRLLYPSSFGLRFGTVCGSSPNLREELMVNSMVKSAVIDGVVRYRNPTAWRPVLDISDLCRGVDQILKGNVSPGTHNLCSYRDTVAGYAADTSRSLDVPTEHLPDTPAYNFDMEPAEWFEPQATIASTIADLIVHHGERWRALRSA